MEKRAELERKLLEAKQTVIDYERTPRPFRKVTESEYQQAKRDMMNLSAEIHKLDYEASKPVDKFEELNVEQLKQLYEQMKSEITGDDKRWGDAGFTVKQTDHRKLAELLKLQTKIQKMEESNQWEN